MILKKFIFIISILLLYNCKSSRISKGFSNNLESSFYNNQFTGVLVINPRTKDTIVNYNANKYFTPASNTKIFTLFSALQFLPDSIPAFKYAINKDTLSVLGTGDPSFLHPFFADSTALKMALKYKKVHLVINNLVDDKFAPGWAWEDFDTYFSPERSALPMYGNVLSVSNMDSLDCSPSFLRNKVHFSDQKFRRDYGNNEFYYNPNNSNSVEIPMVMDSLLIRNLWNSLLPNRVSFKKYIPQKMEIAYSIPSDSLYKRMLFTSDNFLAEQMLVLASSTLSDTLNSSKIRDLILSNYLADLKQLPRWVDGSGLSRYNLFTPTSFVQVLSKLYVSIPRDRLLHFFPVGGVSGTLKNWYAGNPRPYIYAKSGSLSNNYCLSGFLITNKGETLIFSFMNNHFNTPTKAVKRQMEVFFEALRDQY